MQRRTHDGGITTVDQFVSHEAGCASVSHPGMTCDEAILAWQRGKLPRTNNRNFRPTLLKKASSGPSSS